jgi:D-tagatose-1,6-bisphosphate aldolase subunit GatZ/KbaZ
MWLDEVISAQKRGEARGITSICSAHPYAIRAAIQQALKTNTRVLFEATCNQVNQFGGYTGMTPADFVRYVSSISLEYSFPPERILLGGDHLGPNVWQNEPAESAMHKSAEMIQAYVQAGFIKIHLDCSMPLADDPKGSLDVELSAQRTAQLARVAEEAHVHIGGMLPRYIIGSEVPLPGGSQEHEQVIQVTKVEDVHRTIQVTHQAFSRLGLESAWQRVVAVVVQPGVEFGDDFVQDYQPEAASDLVRFIESESHLLYEAHSTDYQSPKALQDLVRDHFAILKVGPALTFAFREAVFALAMMEDELIPPNDRSNLIAVLDEVMLHHAEYWRKYYSGTPQQQAFKRKYSFSDRTRYYWTFPEVQTAFERLLSNLRGQPLPLSLVSQFQPSWYARMRSTGSVSSIEALLYGNVRSVLQDYIDATCNTGFSSKSAIE